MIHIFKTIRKFYLEKLILYGTEKVVFSVREY